MDIKEISNKSSAKTRIRFGKVLVSKGLLNDKELDKALDKQRTIGGRIGEVLLRLKIISEAEMINALAEHLSLRRFKLDDIKDIDIETARTLPANIAKRFKLVVISKDGGNAVIAMVDPLDVVARDIVEQKLRRPVEVVLGRPHDINSAIEQIYNGSDVEKQRLRDLGELQTDPFSNDIDLLIEEITHADTNEADITETEMNK